LAFFISFLGQKWCPTQGVFFGLSSVSTSFSTQVCSIPLTARGMNIVILLVGLDIHQAIYNITIDPNYYFAIKFGREMPKFNLSWSWYGNGYVHHYDCREL